ncbi:HAD family hydrolase [Haladaptatus pallidirubidus]|uniref:TIGR02253 family HAD-type hydrolase n=1 Tax=Haladaptatus pallidirubidus TaxID=1008152 RepID=A0AAV3UR10_9EURY|nr:HAD family hydrolase [Haladaptatus pallidirubidus]
MTNDVSECEAVFWDIGGVLLDVKSARKSHWQFVEALADEYDLLLPVEDAIETWRAVVGQHFRERNGTEFRSSRAAYEKAVDEVTAESIPTDSWVPLFERIQRETLQPNVGAVETVKYLDEIDLHVGVVSDIDDKEAKLILDSFGVMQSFDSVTTSESVGWTKPNPRMFEAALRKASVRPSNAVMIGDRYEHDMVGATEVGMCTVAYGADDGAAVDYHVEDLQTVIDLVEEKY